MTYLTSNLFQQQIPQYSSDSNLSIQSIFFILYIGALVATIFVIISIIKKYNQRIEKMKINGSYLVWQSKNKGLIFFERLFKYMYVLCFASFVLLNIFEIQKNNLIFIELAFPFLFISIVFNLILYLKLPK